MSGLDDYTDYADWKSWDNPFTFDAEDASRFATETAGLVIAGKAVLEIGFGEGRFLAWAQAEGGVVCG